MIVLSKLDKIDKNISKWIHQKDHLISTVILYPFAAFFHPALIWLAYLSVYLLSNQNLRFTAIYALATLICLLATTFIKKMAKRARPELNISVKKPHHFRKKQKNNAMPSGDAIQGALFTVFLLQLQCDPKWVILFHIGVCLGRVYYMCHWVADTIIATALGVSIGKVILKFYVQGLFEFLPSEL